LKEADAGVEVYSIVVPVPSSCRWWRKNSKAIHSFFVTDARDRFIKVGRRFLGEKVESAVRIER
jgi:hypothetical protein